MTTFGVGWAWRVGRRWRPALALGLAASGVAATPVGIVPYQVKLDVVSEGYEPGRTCWFHPRAGVLPGAPPTVVLTMQKLNLKRSDVFYPIASTVSTDGGATWTPIVEH